jgi:hypothetical protein
LQLSPWQSSFFFSSVHEPSEHFLSFSQQAALPSGFAQDSALFLAQQDLFIMEHEEIERSAARVRNDKVFIKNP